MAAVLMGYFTQNEVLFQQTLVYMILAISIQVVLRSGVVSLASIGFLALCALRIRSMLARNSTPFRLDLIGTPTNSTIVVASLVLLLAVVPVVIYAVYSFVNFIAS